MLFVQSIEELISNEPWLYPNESDPEDKIIKKIQHACE